MEHKYGLLIYDDAVAQGGKFDVVTVGNQYIWKNGYIGKAIDKNGQAQYIWDTSKIIPMLIVEDSNWLSTHDDIINDAAAVWNLANPNNTTGSMQLIFNESEKNIISSQLQTREQDLING